MKEKLEVLGDIVILQRDRACFAHALIKRILIRALSSLRYAIGGTASLEKQTEIEEDANYSREEAVV
jgi:hypothetical protein